MAASISANTDSGWNQKDMAKGKDQSDFNEEEGDS